MPYVTNTKVVHQQVMIVPLINYKYSAMRLRSILNILDNLL
jgi:hypothetical protein